nr:reverse transcriptase domain-containing protein [Tanacetum cinerariifolium]
MLLIEERCRREPLRIPRGKRCSQGWEERKKAYLIGWERTKVFSESEDSRGGHWKSRLKKQKSSIEEDLSQPSMCKETDPFTPCIRYFDFPKKTRMPSNVKTYDGSEDPEDHLKFFQAAAKVECWVMPAWCHMFNSTLIGSARVWFDDLPPESVDSYDDLKKALLVNFLQQKRCIKDPVEIRHIKQREGESTEDFVQRFKSESRHVNGAPECMRISAFMHGITNLELIKCLHDNMPKSVDEIMRSTTASSNQARKKTLPAWRQQETGRKQNFNKIREFRNQQRSERRRDRLRPEVKSQMVLAAAPLIGFSIEIIWPIGQISLSVKIGDTEHSTSTRMNFVVVRSPSPYNGIIGRPGVRKIQAVSSTAHGMLKFPVPGGIVTLETPAERSRRMSPSQAEEKKPSTRKKQGNIRGSQKTCRIGIIKEFHYHSWLSNPVMQHLVDKAFQKQIGKNLDVYVDDLVIKSRTKQEIIRDVKETFKTLRKINMKLNLKKCTFGVEKGMVLEYMVNTKGIKVCPNKVEVVLSLPSLKMSKRRAKAEEKLASLNRFLAKSAQKSLSFFKTLKKCTKKSDFQRTTEAEAAFKQMKKLIAELPTLTALMEKEELVVYLATAGEAVSTVLMTE